MPESEGLCKCGCGQLAPLASRTRHERGMTRGQPLDYIPSHRPVKKKYVEVVPASVESTYCLCGCGGITSLATATRADRGQTKGEPINYLRGHYPRKKNEQPRKRSSGKPKLSIAVEESRKREGKAQVKCIDCGAAFPEKSIFGYSFFRCPTCKEKIAALENSITATPSCTWCEEDSIAHSDKSMRNRLYTCLKHWDKLKSTLRDHYNEKESYLVSSMNQFRSEGI